MSAGGSNSKTPAIVLVIIGIILIGALIGIFFPKGLRNERIIRPTIDTAGYVEGQQVNPVDSRTTSAYYQKADIDKPVCGIKIFSPLPGQRVSFPLEVSGYINGCGWVPSVNQIGTLEIRDRNSAISQLIILPVENDGTFTLPAYFKVKVTPQTMPTSIDGVLIFHNENVSGQKSETFQLPILF